MKMIDYYIGTSHMDRNESLTEEERKVIEDYYQPREDLPSLNFYEEIHKHEKESSLEKENGPDRQNFEFEIPTD